MCNSRHGHDGDGAHAPRGHDRDDGARAPRGHGHDDGARAPRGRDHDDGARAPLPHAHEPLRQDASSQKLNYPVPPLLKGASRR